MARLQGYRIGISSGDINGIGPEVILRSLSEHPEWLRTHAFILYGHPSLLDASARGSLDPHNLIGGQEITSPGFYIYPAWKEELEIEAGRPTKASGYAAKASLEHAARAWVDSSIDALVTAPIDKKNINEAGFGFPGHTEYLADACGVEEPLMFLVTEALRVGVVTGHIPLKDVPSQITAAAIGKKAKAMQMSLMKDFGIKRPRIALLGLNPHAGDRGLIGSEDEEVIRPFINGLDWDEGEALGPLPADGFFGGGAYKDFDGVLAMYHDQGLIPFKTLSFGKGVNFTAGLPFIRTSPDHGTAFDLAGKGMADSRSFSCAIELAIEIIKSRRKSS